MKLVVQRLDETIAELIKHAPASGPYVQQLSALKLSIKQLSQDLDPAELVTRIAKVVGDLKQSGDSIGMQHKAINDLVSVL